MKQKISSEYYVNHISNVISVSTSTDEFLNIPKQSNRYLFIKQAEQLFGSIDALVRIAGIEADDPHPVFMDALRFILKESKGDLVQTFLEMFFLPSNQDRNAQRVAICYFIQHMVTFIGVSAEIEKRLINNPDFINTSIQYQLFYYINFRNAEKQFAEWLKTDQRQQYNREKNLEAVMQAANDLVKNLPSGQGVIGKMNQFNFVRGVEISSSEKKSKKDKRIITDDQRDILWNDEKQFQFMDKLFEQIEKMQDAAKLPDNALEVHIITPVAELIPAKVKDWDNYFIGMLKKAVDEWVTYLSPCLDNEVLKAPGRATGLIGKKVGKIKRDMESLDGLPLTKMAPLDLAEKQKEKMIAILTAKLKKHKIKANPENVIRAFQMKADGELMAEIKATTGVDERSLNRYKELLQDDRELYLQLTKFLTSVIEDDIYQGCNRYEDFDYKDKSGMM